MSHKDANDREFDALLSGADSDLARLYRKLPQAEPDARLDAAVLAMAHRALNPHLVAASKLEPRRRRTPAWIFGLGSAAGVVMAAGLAWQMRSGFDQQAADAMRPASTTADKADVVAVSPILHDAPAPPAAPPPPPLEAPHPPTPFAKATAPAASAPLTRAPVAAEKPKPVAAPSVAASVEQDRAAPREEESRLTAKAEQPEAFPQAGAEAQSNGQLGMQEAKESVAVTGARVDSARQRERNNADLNSVERKAALAAGTRRDEGYALDKDKKQEIAPADAAGEDLVAAVPTKRAEPVAAAAPAMAAETTTAASTPAPAARAGAIAGVSGNAAPSPADAAAGESAAGPVRSAELERNARLPAKEWLTVIEKLLKAGHRHEAIDNLDLFLLRHPDHAIPADLRDLHR